MNAAIRPADIPAAKPANKLASEVGMAGNRHVYARLRCPHRAIDFVVEHMDDEGLARRGRRGCEAGTSRGIR